MLKVQKLFNFNLIIICLLVSLCQSMIGVFDAGSTGTRLKVYEFTNNKLTNAYLYKGISNKGIHELTEQEINLELLNLLNEFSYKFYGSELDDKILLESKQMQQQELEPAESSGDASSDFQEKPITEEKNNKDENTKLPQSFELTTKEKHNSGMNMKNNNYAVEGVNKTSNDSKVGNNSENIKGNLAVTDSVLLSQIEKAVNQEFKKDTKRIENQKRKRTRKRRVKSRKPKLNRKKDHDGVNNNLLLEFNSSSGSSGVSYLLDNSKGNLNSHLNLDFFNNSNNQKEDIYKIPLYFYGTAGLRLQSKQKSKRILELVKTALSKYNLKEVKLLSGQEEALYTMIAYNYVYPEDKKFSIIDMGGRSVQIANVDDKNVELVSLDMGILFKNCGSSNDKKGDQSSGEVVSYKQETDRNLNISKLKTSNLEKNNSFASNLIEGKQIKKDFEFFDKREKFTNDEFIREDYLSGISKVQLSCKTNFTECVESYRNSIKDKNELKDLPDTIKKDYKTNGYSFLIGIDTPVALTEIEENTKSSFLLQRDAKLCTDKFIESKKPPYISDLHNITLFGVFEELQVKRQLVKDIYKQLVNECELKQDENLNEKSELAKKDDSKNSNKFVNFISNFSLSKVFNSNNDEQCSKRYFLYRFLKFLNVEDDAEVKIPNLIQSIDINWSLGKAIEEVSKQ